MKNGSGIEEVTVRRGFWFAKAMKVLVIVAVAVGVMGFVAMYLWNWLVPTLFAGPALNYWQALGLLVLARLLFGGLRPRGCSFGRWRHRSW